LQQKEEETNNFQQHKTSLTNELSLLKCQLKEDIAALENRKSSLEAQEKRLDAQIEVLHDSGSNKLGTIFSELSTDDAQQLAEAGFDRACYLLEMKKHLDSAAHIFVQSTIDTVVTVINKKKEDLNQTIEKTEKTAKNMITMMRTVNFPEEVITNSLEEVRGHTESLKRELVKWTEHEGRIGEVRALEQTKYRKTDPLQDNSKYTANFVLLIPELDDGQEKNENTKQKNDYDMNCNLGKEKVSESSDTNNEADINLEPKEHWDTGN